MTVCMTALESAEERRLFEDVYRACCGRMLALARRRLSAQADAEDAVQQSFLALAERFSRLAKLPETQLEAYLVVTVERKCIDILRQQARRDGVPFDENTVLVTPPPCGDPVADAMGRLPPRCREALLLRYGCGYSTRETAALLASELPETGAPPSPEFTRRMEPVVQQGARRQSRRRMWQRTAAALVTVCLSCGVILAASPVARAAVSRWFVQITELVTAYRITPADAGGTVQDYTPTAPLGYVLSGDFTGRENGIRVMRWTSSQGDLLFEAVPMTGDEPISVELRSNSTGGLSSTETGQRPTGGAGEPEDYETENVTVHGLSARLYRILPAKGASPQVQHGCGLWFYRGSDPVHFHQVSIPEGAAALVWVDERANCLFLLIGGQSRQELVSTAESMYESERS